MNALEKAGIPEFCTMAGTLACPILLLPQHTSELSYSISVFWSCVRAHPWSPVNTVLVVVAHAVMLPLSHITPKKHQKIETIFL